MRFILRLREQRAGRNEQIRKSYSARLSEYAHRRGTVRERMEKAVEDGDHEAALNWQRIYDALEKSRPWPPVY